MTLNDIINKVFNEEELPVDEKTGKKKRGILLLDIDDTLLKATDIYIWRKRPEDKKEIRLTPDQYAKEKVAPGEKKYYSYREFRDLEKVKNSIEKGIPYINNLKIMDKFINGGYKIGVLTARGLEQVVYDALSKFLKYRAPDGNLKSVEIPRKYFFAVNDDEKVYAGRTDYEKKRNVINKIRRYFDYVYFLDDDIKNIKEVISLKKSLPDKQAKKIRTITATKPNLQESFLTEMAVKDLLDQGFRDLLLGVTEKDENGEKRVIKKPNLRDAGIYYIDKVIKEAPSKGKGSKDNIYTGKSWIESARSISVYGVGRTVNTALKQGKIDKSFAEKVIKAVDLAVSDPPKDRDIKNSEEEIESKEAELRRKTEKIEKEREGLTDGEVEKIDNFVIRTRKEISNINKVSNALIKNFLEDEKSEFSSAVIDGYLESLKWVNTKFIPPFIKEISISRGDLSRLPKGRKERFEEMDGDVVKENSLKTLWRLEDYSKKLNEVNDRVDIINYHMKLKTKEEKIDELKNDVWIKDLYEKLNPIFEEKDKKTGFNKLPVFNPKEEVGASGSVFKNYTALRDIVTEYLGDLSKLEKAYNEGNLRTFLRINFRKLRNNIRNYGVSLSEKKAQGEKVPTPHKDFMEEVSKEGPEIENSLLRGVKSSKIRSIIKERQDDTKYAFSASKFDKGEVDYINKFIKDGIGEEEKIFNIVVNMYLDFLDGIDILLKSRERVLVGDEESSKNIKTKIDKHRYVKNRSEELRKKDRDLYDTNDVKDALLLRAHKSEEPLKEKTNELIGKINFNNIDDEDMNYLIALSTNKSISDIGFYNDLMKKVNLSYLDIKTAKEKIDKEIEKMSGEEKFKNRIAITINYKGGRFSDKETIELATSIISDPTGEAFKEKLKEEKFSRSRAGVKGSEEDAT